MKSKAEIRREMIEKRKAFSLQNGEEFTDRIRELECYKNARSVMIYMPIKGECDVTGLLSDNKTFLTPVTEGDDMRAVLATGDFEKSNFGVLEPLKKIDFDKEQIDMVIVPGVAFDKEFNRMGFGKGFYDRFLKNFTAVKVGVCHSFQLIDEIESEEHDIKMDIIVTEDAVWSRENI